MIKITRTNIAFERNSKVYFAAERYNVSKGIKNMEQDWRLKGQQKYLKDVVLYRIVFPQFWSKAFADKNEFYQSILRSAKNHVKTFPKTKEYLEGEKIQLFWHEHCEFCWEKAMTNMECEFYCTKDMKHWICQECFNDFKDKFGWIVKSADELFD